MILGFFGNLIDLIRRAIASVMICLIILIMILWTLGSSIWTSIWERNVPSSQIQISNIEYRVGDIDPPYDANIVASAQVNNHSTRDLTDYQATLTVYDCPSSNSPVATCDILGKAVKGPDGDIEKDITFLFSENFSVPNMAKPRGILVPKLVISDFQG